MDLPAVVTEFFPEVDMEAVYGIVEEYQPALSIVKHTWTHQTFLEILQGRVTVPDGVVNDFLATYTGEDKPLKEIKIHSRDTGRLELYGNSASIGRIEFSGTIEEFVHNESGSFITYRVQERALKDHGLASWFFSRMSLSFAEKIFGKLVPSEDIPVNIKGNRIMVDLSKAMETSPLAEAEFKGHRLLDMLYIDSVEPKEGYLVFQTRFNVPEDVKNIIVDILK